MKRHWHLALVLLFAPLHAPASPAATPDPPPAVQPDPAWPRQRDFDLQHVALDLRFGWPRRQVIGRATLRLVAFRPTGRIALDAGRLGIDSVTTADGTALAYTYDGGDRDGGLAIRLDRTYGAGEPLELAIAYRTLYANPSDPANLGGSNGRGLRFLVPTTTEPRRRRQIWSSPESSGNRYWFPSYDAPNDLRTSELTATVDAGLTVVSNGALVEARTLDDGQRRFHWRMDHPHANARTGLVVGEFVDIRQQVDGVQVHNLGYADESEAVAASIVRLPDMLRYFREYTGVDFPYPGYTQVFVQDLPWGLPHAGFSTQTENMIDDAGTHDDYFYLWDNLQAESLAAQWFGGHLSARRPGDAWLERGFARYLADLYCESRNGIPEHRLWLLNWQQSAYLADWAAGVRVPVSTDRPPDMAAFVAGNHPTLRGALVLHMLRKELGDAGFRSAVRLFVARHGGGQAGTEDLRDAIEDATGASMDWFFAQWVHGIGHPVFEVTQDYDAKRSALRLAVRQTQQRDPAQAYPQVEYFRGHVDVAIDGRIETVWLAPVAENTFTFAQPRAPRWVSFDVGSTWIKELTFARPRAALIRQFTSDPDVLGRDQAMQQLVTLAKDPATTPAARAEILAAFRTVIGSDVYWRMRTRAMGQWSSLLVPDPAAKPPAFDAETVALLQRLIRTDMPWVRNAALSLLGSTRDPQYAPLYIAQLRDRSDRVINAAAIALGKSRSPDAYAALVALAEHPSWKSQSLISALYGLKALGDPRGAALALGAVTDDVRPRWTLATPIWDFRLAAADTLAALGRGGDAYPRVLARFEAALVDDDVNNIFSNVLLMASLRDPRALSVFPRLRERFAGDAGAMAVIEQYEAQLRPAAVSP